MSSKGGLSSKMKKKTRLPKCSGLAQCANVARVYTLKGLNNIVKLMRIAINTTKSQA